MSLPFGKIEQADSSSSGTYLKWSVLAWLMSRAVSLASAYLGLGEWNILGLQREGALDLVLGPHGGESVIGMASDHCRGLREDILCVSLITTSSAFSP